MVHLLAKVFNIRVNMSRARHEYCIAKKPTPVLNTPDFNGVFGGEKLPLDEKGLLRPLELIALPGTKFRILKNLPGNIYEIVTNDYPHGPQYIDGRFVEAAHKTTPARIKNLPSAEIIFSRLEGSLGLPYIWGGNWSKGIPEISLLYKHNIPTGLEKIWTLAGVDCSGLLYEATNGFTPRNTSELLYFGTSIPSISDVKPLDIVVYPGHVMIFLTPTLLIESLYSKGVITTPASDRLSQLRAKEFVIRRFI